MLTSAVVAIKQTNMNLEERTLDVVVNCGLIPPHHKGNYQGCCAANFLVLLSLYYLPIIYVITSMFCHLSIFLMYHCAFANGVLVTIITYLHACLIFLLVNCWPNEVGNKCDVNIEYELEREDMELNDVVITIPMP